MAGAGDARDRRRPVPGAVLARACGCALPPLGARRRCSALFCRRRSVARRSRCSACACRAASTALRRARSQSAASRIGRPPRSPTRSPATSKDPVAQALWQAHRRARAAVGAQAQGRLARAAAGAARSVCAARTRAHCWSIATFFAAGGERWTAHRRRLRLARRRGAGQFPRRCLGDAADLYRQAAADPAGLAPRRTAQAAATAPIAVPAGTMLVVRATGNVASRCARQGRPRGRRAEGAARPAGRHRGAPLHHQRRRLGDACTALGDDLAWSFNAIPDRAPTIALTKDPERQARGALRLDYKIEDDYGVIERKAIFARKDELGRRCKAAPAVRRARFRAGAAAGAHAQRRGADHQGSDRASLGRRRRDDDAGRARRSRQRRPQRRRTIDACRSAFSSSRWRAR